METNMKTEIQICENAVLGEKYYHIHHKSGLAIYVFPKELSTTYALFATRYGSADRRFSLNDTGEIVTLPDGIAHFLEHKMFEDADGSDAFARFANTGANANAFTSALTTAYLFSCTEQFTDSLGILLDMVTHPSFSAGSVEKERGIIAEEIRMGEDSPSHALYYGMLDALYSENHLRIPVAGSVESILQITPEILYRCHSVFYNLHNMALFVCGNVTPETVISLADAHLTYTPPVSVTRLETPEPVEVAARRVRKQMQVARPLFAIAFKDTAIPHHPRERMRRQAVMDILNEMLFSQSSPLRVGLYEDGCIGASLSYGYCVCRRYAYNAVSGESPDPEAVFDRCMAYLSRLRAEGVDPEAFERCKRVIYADCVSSFDDTSEIAHALMDAVLDEEALFDEPECIASVTIADVEAALADMFDEEKAVMSVVEPLSDSSEKEKNV